MKKIILPLLFSIALIITCVCAGCSDEIPEKPDDAALEFWLTQDMSEIDLKGYYFIPGTFGGSEFYGKDYRPTETVGEDGEIHKVNPQHYVIYTITAYPDYADGGKYITTIEITDPEITVYGITCNSSLKEFDETMQNLGYTVSEETATLHSAKAGKVSFRFVSYENKGKLLIIVNVTNKYGIIY
ncbi:MAG: hypothetical protein K2K80_04645 [Clostridia bacterium]|nr:hypothetical protein [Clostridia bacterium]